MRALACLFFALLPQAVLAANCVDTQHQERSYTTCKVDARTESIHLFLRDADGKILGQFRDVANSLEADQVLALAMNAGMYHADRAPVGHYVENGKELTPLLTNASPGNFGLLPNGVFCIGDGRAKVMETRAFAKHRPVCRDATQSGPMLVIEGALHPRFLVDSTSRFIRNGVGTSADGHDIYFVISNAPVSFHEFGSYFRDVLQTPNALYMDGKISRLYAPQLDRSDAGFWMGPILGVLENK